MSESTTMMKTNILKAESLEMEICDKLNVYINVLRRVRDVCDEQIDGAKKQLKLQEDVLARQKEDLKKEEQN